jgi:hypothetical protein
MFCISIRGHEALLGGPSGGVCPVCQRGSNPGVKVCPDHGEELLSAPVAGVAALPSQQAAPGPRRGKSCPKCGTRFDGNASLRPGRFAARTRELKVSWYRQVSRDAVLTVLYAVVRDWLETAKVLVSAATPPPPAQKLVLFPSTQTPPWQTKSPP